MGLRSVPSMQLVSTRRDIDVVATLAQEIWTEHFTPIIGKAQVDYMLDELQSAAAIARQIREGGHEYYLVLDEDEPEGYFALVPDAMNGTMQLSKLYLRRSHRGRGLGKAMVAFVERECAARGIGEIWLTVNKGNAGPIAFYQRAGFTIAEPIVTDIGNGFVMDDYRMVKRLAPACAGSKQHPTQS